MTGVGSCLWPFKWKPPQQYFHMVLFVFSAFHTQKNGHFVKCWLWTPLAVKGLKSLSGAQCQWYRLSKTQFCSHTKLCIIEAIKLHLFVWFQDGEVNCSNITCQPLNCTEAPILLPLSCCPVCPGKCLIFCYMKSWQTPFTRAKKIGTACQILAPCWRF